MNLGDILTSGMPFVFVDGQRAINSYSAISAVAHCWKTSSSFNGSPTGRRLPETISSSGARIFATRRTFAWPATDSRTGSFGFFNSRTQGPTGGGLGLATFLLGDVSAFSRFASSIDDAGERQKRWFFYGQDTFRVTRKLVLNYGLRWEIYFPQSVTGKGAGGWVDLGTGLVNVAGFGNINLQGNVKHNFTNFAPRLGIAYQATSKTVVRLGYGRSFDLGVFGSNFGHTATQNLPVLVAQQINPSSAIPGAYSISRKDRPHPPFLRSRIRAIPASRPGERLRASAQDTTAHAGRMELDRPTPDHSDAITVSRLCSQQRNPCLHR